MNDCPQSRPHCYQEIVSPQKIVSPQEIVSSQEIVS